MPIKNKLRFTAASALLGLALTSGLCAQGEPDSRVLRGPVIGLVDDETAGIRPILGIPGAATLGPALLARTGLASVAPAPDHDYILAVLTEGRQVAIVRNLSASPDAAVLDVPADPSRIVFSPSGDAAALFYADTARVVAIAGLPSSPAVFWALDLAGVQGGLAALAISDGGGAVLVAASGQPAPVWMAASKEGQRFLYAATASPSLTFFSRSEDAAIADAATGEVVLARDLKGEPKLTRIGGQSEGKLRPIAIAMSRDNRRIFALNAEPARLVSIDLSGDEQFSLACSCSPTTLQRMAGGAVFRLNEPGNGPVWLLDTASAAPRIVFVPDQARPLRDTGPSRVPRRTGGVR